MAKQPVFLYCVSATLGGLFSQILQGEDIVRERAIKFLSIKLKTLPEDTMTKEVEDYVFTETKKVCSISLSALVQLSK